MSARRRRRALAGAALGLAAACATDARPPLPEAPVALRYRTLDGSTETLGALRGHVVVVHVLTTWSDLALLEVPRLARLATRYPDDLRVVALVLDPEDETAAIFADTFDVPYTVARPFDVEHLTGPEGPFGPISLIPTSVVLDRDGRLAARADGTWAPRVLEEIVAKLL